MLNKHQLSLLRENQRNNPQADLIKRGSLTPDQILDHVDDLNAEISETYNQILEQPSPESLKLPEPPKIRKSKKETIVKKDTEESPDDALDRQIRELNAQREALAKQKELETQRQAQSEETEAPEKTPEEQQHDAIMELMKNHPQALSEAQVQQLKAKHGKNALHVLALGEDDVYIFSYLKRGQWKKIQQIVQAASQSNIGTDPDDHLKEQVLRCCVHWPKGIGSPEFLYSSRAGVIDTLYNAIMMNSYFLNPQQTMMLTTQL
jgi:polyhydroxyalkanoate synthesis regulator phasin